MTKNKPRKITMNLMFLVFSGGNYKVSINLNNCLNKAC